MNRDRVRILFFQTPWGSLHRQHCDCCEVTLDHEQWESADAVVFHVPQLGKFPPAKPAGQAWVAHGVESAVHYPMLGARRELSGLFDLWVTYRQDADVWCPYIPLDCVTGFRAAPGPMDPALAPAVAFISSGFDRSNRVALLDGLMRHMPVDSYGKVRNTRTLADDTGPASKRAALARYRFTLAFENAIDEDYVTEKFFEPLLMGSVPVYLGAPNVDAFAPGDDCFIDAARFDSPRALAAHLLALAADETAWQRHHRWRSQPLRPAFLDMMQRIATPPLCRLAHLLLARRAAAPAAGTA